MDKPVKLTGDAANERPKLETPGGEEQLLLHSCCAPCAGDVMNELARSDIDYKVLFYNPNIHPRREYEIRKDENKRHADTLAVDFVDLDYDMDNWFQRMKGFEHEPETGYRCTLCFDMRFERSALYAHEQGYKLFTSTLGTSRWKNMDQINESGVRAAGQACFADPVNRRKLVLNRIVFLDLPVATISGLDATGRVSSRFVVSADVCVQKLLFADDGVVANEFNL